MLISTISAYLLANLLRLADATAFAGFCAGFIVLNYNAAVANKTQDPTWKQRIFSLLSFPFYIALAAYILIPIISYLSGYVIITSSLFDIFILVLTTAAGIAGAFLWLRHGVHKVEKTKAEYSKSSDLERNKKTDVREIRTHIPDAALEFDLFKYLDATRGVFLGLDENKKPVYIEFGGGTSAPHVQVIGTTGAGKGVSLGVMASQFLELGEAVFFCDPKNDEWAPSVMHAAAKRTGKPYHYINLNRPNGAQFDIFEGATVDEAFELFQAGFSLTEKGDASDFYGIADRREAGVVARLIAENHWTIAEAYQHQVDAGVTESAEKFYGKLREMAETPSINAKSGGVSLAKVIEEGGCVYIVGSMRNDIVKTAQRILLVRLIQLAERRDRMAGELRKICIVLDEVKYHLSRPALEGLGAARDKGVHLVLAHQSLGDLRDCTKDLNPDAVVDAVVENCRIKICYKVQSPDTARWLAEMSGTILVDDETRSVEKNIALAETVDNRRSIRQADRYFIDENMLLNLPPSVSVLYGAGLPKFVSIRPLKVPKAPEAVKIAVVDGAVMRSATEAIDAAAPVKTVPAVLDIDATPVKTASPVADASASPFPAADPFAAHNAAPAPDDADLIDPDVPHSDFPL